MSRRTMCPLGPDCAEPDDCPVPIATLLSGLRECPWSPRTNARAVARKSRSNVKVAHTQRSRSRPYRPIANWLYFYFYFIYFLQIFFKLLLLSSFLLTRFFTPIINTFFILLVCLNFRSNMSFIEYILQYRWLMFFSDSFPYADKPGLVLASEKISDKVSLLLVANICPNHL